MTRIAERAYQSIPDARRFHKFQMLSRIDSQGVSLRLFGEEVDELQVDFVPGV